MLKAQFQFNKLIFIQGKNTKNVFYLIFSGEVSLF